MIWKLCKKRLDELKILVIMSVGLYLLSAMMQVLIIHSGDEQTSFAFGTLILIVLSSFIFIFLGAFGYGIEFNLAIGMGKTRKEFFPAYFISSLMLAGIQTIIIYIGYFLEKWEIATFFGQYPYERSIEALLDTFYIIPGAVFLAVAQIFVGSVTMRFGKKAFWGLWLCMMMGCMLPSRFENAMERADGSFFDLAGNAILNWAHSITSTTLIVGITVIGLVMLLITYLIQRKQAFTIM